MALPPSRMGTIATPSIALPHAEPGKAAIHPSAVRPAWLPQSGGPECIDIGSYSRSRSGAGALRHEAVLAVRVVDVSSAALGDRGALAPPQHPIDERRAQSRKAQHPPARRDLDPLQGRREGEKTRHDLPVQEPRRRIVPVPDALPVQLNTSRAGCPSAAASCLWISGQNRPWRMLCRSVVPGKIEVDDP